MKKRQVRPDAPHHPLRDRGDFYGDVLRRLVDAAVPFLVGGAYAHTWVTGVSQHTKDLDLFVRPGDRDRLLEVAQAAGYRTTLPFPHWLAKVHWGEELVDVIYNSGNGEAAVDDEWFAHAAPAEICGVQVRVCPIEEMIWTKAFIMERERFDGADVAHLIRGCAERIDWPRLLRRFGEHWPVLLTHLLLFGYIYPGERRRIPVRLVDDLTARTVAEWNTPPADPKLCRGALLSRAQYFPDLADWRYHDARVPPHGGHLSAADARDWSAASPILPRARQRGAAPAKTRPGARARRAVTPG